MARGVGVLPLPPIFVFRTSSGRSSPITYQ
nr:MAG TPA: hypothetical protein [Caudoviricetes sp.]